MFRRIGIVIAALVAAAGMLLLLIHLPIVRRGVLDYARSRLQRDFRLVLDASRLDYNLATLSIGLADVRVSAEGQTEEPFFESEYVAVQLSRSVFVGRVLVTQLSLTDAGVRIHRRADGTSNLPTSEPGGADEPDALPISRIDAPRVMVDFVDDAADLQVQIPGVAIQLARDVGAIRLAQPASIRVGQRTMTLSMFNSQATFDGRTLGLMDAEVRSDEMAIDLGGSVVLIAREPSMDLAVRGTGNIARLARWGIPEGDVPEGTLAFDGQVSGPLADPRAQLNLTSERIAMGDLVVTDLSGRALASIVRLDLESVQLAVASGQVNAAASFPFAATEERRVTASWDGVDVAAATRLAAPDAEYLPTGSSSGVLAANGVGNEPTGWRGSVTLALAGGRNARGRLAAPGETTLTLNDGQWRVAGRHRVGGVAPVELAGRGQLRAGRPLSELAMDAGTVSLAETSLPSLLMALRDVGLMTGDTSVLKAGRLEARFEIAGPLADPRAMGNALVTDLAGEDFDVPSVRAEISGRPLRPELTYTVEGPTATVAGQRLSDLRASGQLRVAAAAPPRLADNSVRPEPVEGLALVADVMTANQADGSGRLSGDGSYVFVSTRYEASIDVMDWQVAPTDELPASGLVNLRFVGLGTTTAPGGDGEITVRDASWQGHALGELGALVSLDGGPAALIEARAPDFSATATARVDIAAPHRAVVDVRASGLNLARLLRDIETPTPIAGQTTAAVHFEGTLDAWRAGTGLVEVTALDATAGELPIRFTEPARARYEGERIYLDRFEASAGETSLSAFGSLPVFESDTDALGLLFSLTGGVGEVARAVAATGITELPLNGGTGPVALLARVTGSAQTPVVAADLEVGPGTISMLDLPTISNVRVRAHAGDGWLELREGFASYQEAEVTATGRAPLSWATPSAGPPAGGAELHAKATNLTAAVLSPFLDPSAVNEISGSLDASVEATSAEMDLASVVGYFQIDRFDLRVADLPVSQRVPTRIVARDGFARVEAWDWVGQGATLSVVGQVRLEDREAAFLANGLVDLRLLTPFVRDSGVALAGRLEPRLSITGALDNPRIDGDLTLASGELRLSDPRVIVSDLDARAVLNRTSAQITALTGSINGGTLTGGGSLSFVSSEGLGAQLATTIRGMALEFPDGLRSEINADLNLAAASLVGGPDGSEPAGRISGTVTVVQGSYREPLAVVAGILAGMRAQALTTGAAGVTEVSPIMSALALDVRLITEDDIIVDNNYGRLDLGADLRVIGTAAAPSLAGRADLREGGQLFVGRNVYTITSGAIDFTNPIVIEPNLNIVATTRVGAEDIEVTITGSAESPTVVLDSSSGLGEPEIASLLLTGRRLEDLPPGDAAFVGTQVLGNFSAEVLGFASQAVGLDTIRLGGVDTPNTRRNAFESETEVDPTTRLTFGKNIGPNANVTFSQSLRDSDAQAWIVDYALRRGLELRFVSDDDDLRSFGFRHDVSFGGINNPVQPTFLSRAASVTRVTAVNVTGELTVLPEARVRGILRLGPGDRFDFGEWQDDRERLEEAYRDLGYLTPRVTARRADQNDGVVLSYEIATGPQTRIAVTGIELDAGLRSELEGVWSDAVFDDFLTAEAADIVRARLARNGYLRPTVEARTRDENNVKTLEITVDPGPRSGSTVLRIEGAPDMLAEELEVHLKARSLVEGVVLNPNAVEREGTAYLRGLGYLRARVSAGAPLFEGDTAVVPLRVDAGPVFTVAGVAFEGAQTLMLDTLRETTELKEETPYDPSALEGARNRVLALYRREGFAQATVSVRPTVREEASAVDLSFVVVEGAREQLEEIVVIGNRSIDTDVVLRSIDLETGEPLRTEELLQARTRLFNTGLFRRIDIASEPVVTANASENVAPVRLRVTVEEWPALRLRYGVLVAEEFRADELNRRELVPGVSADVSRRTLFGRAVTVGAVLGLQRREQRGRVYVSTPTLMGLPIESSLIAGRSHEVFQGVTLVTNKNTLSWEQRSRLARYLDLSYSYTFEQNRTFDTAPPDPFVPALDIRINIARLNAAAAWDSRDDPSDTTRGVLASTSVEYAPATLGSDIRFIRQVAQAYYFRTLRRAVLASAVRVGNVTPLGGQDLIPSERFFSGGSRSVRSVAEDSLGPRFFFDNSPEGGQMMVVLNQEVRVPLYKWMRGVAFVDAGNVFTEARDASLRDLVGSLGVGLRFATPFALLRVDYAKTAWGGGDEPSSGRWVIGIGHAF
jgi:outer membrane protein assembly factor BamA/autotransporter translocation and assembly factor TamB